MSFVEELNDRSRKAEENRGRVRTAEDDAWEKAIKTLENMGRKHATKKVEEVRNLMRLKADDRQHELRISGWGKLGTPEGRGIPRHMLARFESYRRDDIMFEAFAEKLGRLLGKRVTVKTDGHFFYKAGADGNYDEGEMEMIICWS